MIGKKRNRERGKQDNNNNNNNNNNDNKYQSWAQKKLPEILSYWREVRRRVPSE